MCSVQTVNDVIGLMCKPCAQSVPDANETIALKVRHNVLSPAEL